MMERSYSLCSSGMLEKWANKSTKRIYMVSALVGCISSKAAYSPPSVMIFTLLLTLNVRPIANFYSFQGYNIRVTEGGNLKRAAR